jgi:hypothetical protein
MRTAIEKKVEALLATAFEKLPKRLKCPKCKRSRTKDRFGLRGMARDANGVPTKVTRQSYCSSCRGS